MATPRLIALLTDFGTRDWYVAALKGVLLTRAPGARLVDITHEIPPQDVLAGAFMLATAAPWFPTGTVFLAVVDPGVGSDRAVLAVQTERHYFIGPDNGLLAPSVGQAKRRKIRRLTNHRLWLPQVSATFHGRDIIAPVAAYLAKGGVFQRVGVLANRMVALRLPAVQRVGRVMRGQVIHIDTFGNLVTNIPAASTVMRTQRSWVVRYKDRNARLVPSYTDGRGEELVAVVGSLGLLELAIREGSAAWALAAKRGDEVKLVMKRR